MPLLAVHRIPSLEVLDQHKVTPQERQKAKAVIGGDVQVGLPRLLAPAHGPVIAAGADSVCACALQALTVAFMQRLPPFDPKWFEKVPVRSALEQELVKVSPTRAVRLFSRPRS